MRTPNGLDEIKALYGDPTPYIREDGTPSPLWEMRMVRVEFPGPLPLGWDKTKAAKGARVHQIIASELASVFRSIEVQRLWDHIVTFDGGYTWRPQRGAARLSMHSYGGAVDFNAETNALGAPGDMHPGIVQVFESHGWEWGGRWHRPDPMHFQFAKGY